MAETLHQVAGFFAKRADATFSRLVVCGLSREQMEIFAAESAEPGHAPSATSNEVLKDVLAALYVAENRETFSAFPAALRSDGAIGSAVGTGMGVLAQVAPVAANVSLFVASPLIAPLAMLGWDASLGGLSGAASGAGNKEGGFSALIVDAIASGQVVLVAETRTLQETAIARQIIEASVGEDQDVGTA